MSQFVAFGLYDGEATPVSHAYTPDIIDAQGTAHWETSPSYQDAKERITLNVQKPRKGKTARRRVALSLFDPLMDAVDPTKRVGENSCHLQVYIDPRSTAQQAKNLRTKLTYFIRDVSAAIDAIEQGRSVY